MVSVKVEKRVCDCQWESKGIRAEARSPIFLLNLRADVIVIPPKVQRCLIGNVIVTAFKIGISQLRLKDLERNRSQTGVSSEGASI